jgi:hypothetical protein
METINEYLGQITGIAEHLTFTVVTVSFAIRVVISAWKWDRSAEKNGGPK